MAINLIPPKANNRNIVLHEWLRAAVALHTQNKLGEAEVYYQAILKSQPSHFHALHMLGVLRRQQGRGTDAVKLFRQALKVDANSAGLHSDLGTTLGQLGYFEDALGSYDRSIGIKPDNAASHNDRAAMLFKLNRFEEAIASFDRAIALNPHYAEAYRNRGAALKELGRLDEALVSIDRAIAYDTNSADAYNVRGVILLDLRRGNYGLDDFDRALAIRPDHTEAMVNRGACLFELNRSEDAISALEKALQGDRNNAEAHFIHGNTLAKLKLSDEAIAAYDRALALSPGLAKAEFNRARQLLLLGDLAAGWRGYERRVDEPHHSKHWTTGPYPVWTGQKISGKRIIVYSEQGIGDIIQFARYLPLLVELGAEVTFLVLPQVRRLLRSLSSSIILIEGDPNGSFDFQCTLLSLPMAFKTTLATIPNSVPYLRAEPSVVSRWASQFKDGGYKIGIAWQGNPVGSIDVGRSIPLACFAHLAKIAGVRLISLQKNHGLEQLADLAPDVRVGTLGNDFDVGPDAFLDTAAIMEHLDLIITSDTSIAHLAGALGRPVWVALKHVPDWRWLLDRSDSPWYPTMRLYRQRSRGDWTDVFERITADLSSVSNRAA